MKYYLLSHALGFDKLFDSLDELSYYVWAKTGSNHLPIEFIKEYLREHPVYQFSSWDIDLAIFRRPSAETKSMQLSRNDPKATDLNT